MLVEYYTEEAILRWVFYLLCKVFQIILCKDDSFNRYSLSFSLLLGIVLGFRYSVMNMINVVVGRESCRLKDLESWKAWHVWGTEGSSVRAWHRSKWDESGDKDLCKPSLWFRSYPKSNEGDLSSHIYSTLPKSHWND